MSTLRSVVDDRANSAGLSRLIVAVETLTRFMKDAKPAEQDDPFDDGVDPHEKLMDTVTRYLAAKEAQVEDDRRERAAPLTVEEAQARRIVQLEDEVPHLRGTKPRRLAPPSAKPFEADAAAGDDSVDGDDDGEPEPAKPAGTSWTGPADGPPRG